MYDREIVHYEVTVFDFVSLAGTYRELYTKVFHAEEEAIAHARSQESKTRKVRVREISNIIGWWND